MFTMYVSHNAVLYLYIMPINENTPKHPMVWIDCSVVEHFDVRSLESQDDVNEVALLSRNICCFRHI